LLSQAHLSVRIAYPALPIVEGATFWPPLVHQRMRIKAIFSETEQEQEEVMADRKELKKVNKTL
jgi:hypothetical protein